LKTIATNTDLGSGMRVALKDLEIRGAGNLLGGEQSGHIADVGFDLYMRMVGEAVQEYKSGIIETEEKVSECKVELPINAHLSAEYVPGERLRLDLYRRLADVKAPVMFHLLKQNYLIALVIYLKRLKPCWGCSSSCTSKSCKIDRSCCSRKVPSSCTIGAA
jgi:transcription-repair coupling factor (superfamily II helicase)